MTIQEIMQYDNIVVQCHNNPDPDALASGYALWKYLHAAGKNVRFVYGGRAEISKPNLLLMIKLLHIPVEYVEKLEDPELLITVDCQYGESNVQNFGYKNLCVIDHHEVMDFSKLPELSEVHENYGSCSTVVYKLLKDAGYKVEEDYELQTALYYGLYMDTGRFQELWHPADRDMWDELKPDEGIMNILQNTNITSWDLMVLAEAFRGHEINEHNRYGIAEVDTADPNLLGIVSDTLLEVDSIDTCVVYSFLDNGVKLSVRSCIRAVRADELAKCIAEGLGNAGGHMKKAGGFIQKSRLPENNDWKVVWKTLLNARLQDYFENTDIVSTGETINTDGFELYRKLPVMAGVVNIYDAFSGESRLKLRTMEGDIELAVSADTLLMIGVDEEIYPIKKETFDKNYILTGEEYKFCREYVPSVRGYMDGRKVSLAGITKECKGLGSSLIYAKPLTRRVHVFTIWDPQKYLYGEAGDWIAFQKDKPEDIYIINESIFQKTYKME